MSEIEVDHLTKDYGSGRGVFDVSFQVTRGECFGFLGPNGAGKSTTIRHLLGFSKPDSGTTKILGKDSFTHYDEGSVIINNGGIRIRAFVIDGECLRLAVSKIRFASAGFIEIAESE